MHYCDSLLSDSAKRTCVTVQGLSLKPAFSKRVLL